MNDDEQRPPSPETKMDVLKYRLSIGGVVFSLLFILFMMFSDAVFNFQCPVIDFITFQCNRFDAAFKPWE